MQQRNIKNNRSDKIRAEYGKFLDWLKSPEGNRELSKLPGNRGRVFLFHSEWKKK